MYYSEGGITIYHGKAEDCVPTLPLYHFAVLIMDPPFSLTLDSIYRFNDCLVEHGTRVMIPNQQTHGEFGHPHVRSLEEMTELLERTRGPILDPYMGTGTTLVAAKKLGRECVGIEIEEKWCLAAAERLKAA